MMDPIELTSREYGVVCTVAELRDILNNLPGEWQIDTGEWPIDIGPDRILRVFSLHYGDWQALKLAAEERYNPRTGERDV